MQSQKQEKKKKMGRGKIEIKRIENSSNRLVTYGMLRIRALGMKLIESKRRIMPLKMKANEI
jgi:hypothetical protein